MSRRPFGKLPWAAVLLAMAGVIGAVLYSRYTEGRTARSIRHVLRGYRTAEVALIRAWNKGLPSKTPRRMMRQVNRDFDALAEEYPDFAEPHLYRALSALHSTSTYPDTEDLDEIRISLARAENLIAAKKMVDKRWLPRRPERTTLTLNAGWALYYRGVYFRADDWISKAGGDAAAEERARQEKQDALGNAWRRFERAQEAFQRMRVSAKEKERRKQKRDATLLDDDPEGQTKKTETTYSDDNRRMRYYLWLMQDLPPPPKAAEDEGEDEKEPGKNAEDAETPR